MWSIRQKKTFSVLGVDKSHEENNVQIKVNREIVGITKDDSALLERILSGPEICYVVEKYEE